MARQGIIAVQHRPHTVCQLVATVQPAPTRDPVREGLCQQEGNLIAVRHTSPAIQAFTQLLRPLLPVPLAARKRLPQIAAATARRLLKNSRQFCRRGNFIIPLRGHQHRGQTRIVAQRRHFLAARRQTLAFQRANAWLNEHGNPYVLSVLDLDGRVGIDYGVYGVPETYVIDKAGVIRMKHTGPISPDVFSTRILPLVAELSK